MCRDINSSFHFSSSGDSGAFKKPITLTGICKRIKKIIPQDQIDVLKE